MKTLRKSTLRNKSSKKRPGVNIPKESLVLLKYIELIGAKRSSFNILGAAESDLKAKGPAPFQFTSY